MKPSHHQEKAFSRTEVLVSTALVFILLSVAFTSLADNKGRSQKLFCLDNLRQIGAGFETWRFDHQDSHPWHVPSTDGGTYGLSVGLPWIEFTFLSNTIASPRILACPSDLKTSTRTAEHWGNAPGGLLHSGHRNNSVSYTVGLHSFFYSPQTILSSDRNLAVRSPNTSCGLAGKTAGVAGIDRTIRASWTNDVHGTMGNLLFNDGSVAESTSPQLERTMNNLLQGDLASVHLLIP